MKIHACCAALLLLLAACGKSDDSSSTSSGDKGGDGGGGGSRASSAKVDSHDNPWDDVAKPCLTDKNMDGFVESLKDAKGPFDAISKGKVTAFNANQRMDEFEAAAKKHGFKSGEEYMAAWVRINTVRSQVQMDEANQSMIKMHEDTIKQHQETMKNPDATPEMKKSLDEQIKSSQEALAALKQPREGGVNAKDVEMYKKHQAAFEEAMKNWAK